MKGKSPEWDTPLMFEFRDGRIAGCKVLRNIQYELDEWWNS